MVGEDVALGDAQPGLATEDALIHSLAPVVYDLIVEQTERFIIKSTLEVTDGPLGYIPLMSNSSRRFTIFQSIKDGQSFESRQWLSVGTAGWLFAQFFQFFPYWGFFLSSWDSTLGSS